MSLIHRVLYLSQVHTGISTAAPQADISKAPTATVHNGTYVGIHNSQYSQDLFLGMRYAQPPVGDLQLQNSLSFNESWNGTRNATAYSAECIGFGSDDWVLGNPISEDCLTINVIRPSGVNPGSDLPVALWIYGGGGFEGGSLDPRYNLSFIVQQATMMNKPFIAVSLNYRVQALGFMFGTPVLEAGISDSVFTGSKKISLAFGGDPSRVTIWGESAGANSVGQQMLAYGGRDEGLFRGAIMENGGFNTKKVLTAAEWDVYYNNITDAVNCSSATDTLACLRTVPIEELIPVLNSSVTSSVPRRGPQVDGEWLLNGTVQMLVDGQIVKVPILHGRNHDEGTMFATQGIDTTEQFLENVKEYGFNDEEAKTLAVLYPDIPAIGIPSTLDGRPTGEDAYLGHQWNRASAFTGDLGQHAPRRLISHTWAKFGLKSWSYHWDVLVNGESPAMGATHFQEVAFVFDNTEGMGYKTAMAEDPFADKPPTFFELATIMSRMWVSFIVDQDPNYSGGKLPGFRVPNLDCILANMAVVTDFEWPVYSSEDPVNMYFNVNMTNILAVEPDYYRAAGIAYIQDRLVPLYGSASG
ncbi:hypothetical protein N7488_012439 [Penicillium malachiteum]|nr:hypothetical protein N7488_012439 [Penicillium malachiteum]